MLAGLVCDLIQQKRVKTTLAKAKAARTLAEKMVTLGKRGTLAHRRRAIAALRQADRVKELFDNIAPSFQERNGGYTRIVKLGKRHSDSSEMVILEWVEKGVSGSDHSVQSAPEGVSTAEESAVEEAGEAKVIEESDIRGEAEESEDGDDDTDVESDKEKDAD